MQIADVPFRSIVRGPFAEESRTQDAYVCFSQPFTDPPDRIVSGLADFPKFIASDVKPQVRRESRS